MTSRHTGPSWFRGYFKGEKLSQQQVDTSLKALNAQTVIVGHTIQRKVNSTYKGKVIGIDVKHPNDYHKNWPGYESEALLIEKGKYFRVLNNGERVAL